MQFSLISLSLVLAIFSIIVVAASVVRSETGSQVSNRLLAGFLIAIACILANFLLMTSGLVLKATWTAWLGNTAGLAAGPLLWLYARSLMKEGFALALRDALHFVPVALLLTIVLASYTSQPEATRLALLTDPNAKGLINSPFVRILAFAIVPPYLALTIRDLIRNRHLQRGYFSSAGPENLSWLLISVSAFVLLWLVSFIHEALIALWPSQLLDAAFLTAMALGTLVLGTYLLFHGLMQSRHVPRQVPKAIESEATARKEKYGADRITDADLATFAARIEAYIKDPAKLSDPALTLTDMAAALAMTDRELSQTINRHFERTFFDLINTARVTLAAEHLLHDEAATVTDVMLAAGFTSKSSFYAAFKRQKGVTPTEYRRSRAPAM